MAKIGYKELLLNYINDQEVEDTITTEQITKYAIKKTNLDAATVRKAVNVNMARLVHDNKITRVTKGIYCKKIKTAFGYYSADRETLFCKELQFSNEDIIGYETGLSILNQIGLVSQMPTKKCIATNHHTKRLPYDLKIEIRKPPITISKQNYRYLQILDIIKEMDKAPIDAVNPTRIIQEAVKKQQLDTNKLIYTARKYYNPKVLIKTIDIVLGESA